MKTNGSKSSQINLTELSKEFQKRHDFNSEELDVLNNNFPNVQFKNIPEAWIVLLDKMLRETGTDHVKSVEQHCGLLCVSETKPRELDLSIVDKYEKRLYKIDEDLHDRLSL